MEIYIHPTAIVESSNIGEKSHIWAFVHILKEAKIGKNVNICDFCFIENDVFVGDNVTIKCGVYIWDGITIENKVFVGSNVNFVNDLLPRSKNKEYKKEKTLLKQGCSIGTGSTILGGIEIGKFAMIGAGSIVTKNVNDYELVYGNPAIHKGYVCKCGKKINNKQKLCVCGREYCINNGKIKFLD